MCVLFYYQHAQCMSFIYKTTQYTYKIFWQLNLNNNLKYLSILCQKDYASLKVY